MDTTHCSDCHEEYAPRQKHVFNCKAVDKDCLHCPADNVKRLREEIGKHVKEKGFIEWAEGIFGDTNQNLAYFEEKLMTDKGMSVKIYGCSYLFKGTLMGECLDSVATVKRTLMATLGVVLKYRYVLPLLLPFHKKLTKDFVYWFTKIYEADLIKKTYSQLAEFSPVPRELIRAGIVLAERIPLELPLENVERIPNKFSPLGGPADYKEFRIKVLRFIWCVGTFVQADSAYYKRPQDAISNLDKESLRKDTRKEILRLFDICLERENTIKEKVAQLRKLVSILLLLPPVKRIAFEYFNELDVSQFVPDEADRYFAARNTGYNFEGKSVEERRKWAEQMDKEKGHTILAT